MKKSRLIFLALAGLLVVCISSVWADVVVAEYDYYSVSGSDPNTQGWTYSKNKTSIYLGGYDMGDGWRIVDGTGTGYALYSKALTTEEVAAMAGSWSVEWTFAMDSDAYNVNTGIVGVYGHFYPPNQANQNNNGLWIETSGASGYKYYLAVTADEYGNLAIKDGVTTHLLTYSGYGIGYDTFYTVTIDYNGVDAVLSYGGNHYTLNKISVGSLNRILFGAMSSSGQGSVVYNYLSVSRSELSAQSPSPSQGELSVNPGIPLLDWNPPAAPGTYKYDVYLGTDPNSMTKVSSDQSDSNYILPSALSYATTYYWRVDTKDSGGTLLETGGRWQFTTKSSQAFEVVVLPDTQEYSEYYPDIFTAQTQWIADNKTYENIGFVTHLGDIVNDSSQVGQWENADDAMDILDGVVPYSASAGNHDYHDRSTVPWKEYGAAEYITHFGPSRYSGYSWYQGSYRNLNHYQIFTAGGRQWLHINFEYDPDDDELLWAQRLIDANPTLPVILSTHAYLSSSGSLGSKDLDAGPDAGNGGSDIWSKFVSHNDQIIMVINGNYPGTASKTSKNDYNHNVFQICVDYQNYDNGGDGYLRIFEFDETFGRIMVKSYSPYTGTYLTDASNQFTLNMDFATRLNSFSSREIISTVQAGNVTVIDVSLTDPNVMTYYAQGGQKTSGFSLGTGRTRGQYYIQDGNVVEGDVLGGIYIASVAQNGRHDPDCTGTAYHTIAVDAGSSGNFVCASRTSSAADPTKGGAASNVNFSSAYFPFSGGWTCGRVRGLDDNLPSWCLVGSTNVHLGAELVNSSAGIWTLTIPGVNSNTDGILLVCGGKNEGNFAGASPSGSGWSIHLTKNTATASQTENDPFNFVYVPYSSPGIVAGRINGNGSIINGTGGGSYNFAVTYLGTGRYRLSINGNTPSKGALLITPEVTGAASDNFLTYQPDDANGCWIIEERDLPSAVLESENFGFVFIPFNNNMGEPPFDGHGTPRDPYRIYTKTQLETVDSWSPAYFKLMNNINLAGTTYTNCLIGPVSHYFSGSFDGQGYTIQNLTINNTTDHLALFGINWFGQISNLTLADVNVVSDANNYAAGLVAENYGVISNCHITGKVSGKQRVGGLAGYSSTMTNISGCSSACTVSGASLIGGLAGYVRIGTVTNSFATGSVTADTNTSNCTGGFIGQSGNSDTANPIINNCYATGAVISLGSLANGPSTGGFIGANYSNVTNCYATGDVNSLGNYTGGFIGQNISTLSDINDCYAQGAVYGYGSSAGGFVGRAIGSFERCHATGNVINTGSSYNGGFAGFMDSGSSAASCYATGNVTTTGGIKRGGGFVGRSLAALITKCYAAGDVNGAQEMGGFAGVSWGPVSDCYATGSVTCSGDLSGGFVGDYGGAGSSAINCYSTGLVTGSTNVGGFAGHFYDGGDVNDCFWDTQTSGQASSAGGTGKTTAEMKQQATFTNWIFPGTWKIRETLSYPKLAWQAFSNSDINWDDDIDFADLKVFADSWLATGSNLPADIHADNKVNFLDFAEFAAGWVTQ